MVRSDFFICGEQVGNTLTCTEHDQDDSDEAHLRLFCSMVPVLDRAGASVIFSGDGHHTSTYQWQRSPRFSVPDHRIGHWTSYTELTTNELNNISSNDYCCGQILLSLGSAGCDHKSLYVVGSGFVEAKGSKKPGHWDSQWECVKKGMYVFQSRLYVLHATPLITDEASARTNLDMSKSLGNHSVLGWCDRVVGFTGCKWVTHTEVRWRNCDTLCIMIV